jgi:hypothetical protein
MRNPDSAYDAATSETRCGDSGSAYYALVSDHNGFCLVTGDYDSLDDAIEAAREMDTDSAPCELEDELGVDCSGDSHARGLIAKAESKGWRVVATAPAGEYWTVLVAPET